MNRQEILQQIQQYISGSGGDISLYERYSTSDLKKILDDLKRVNVVADTSITNVVILAGAFLILGIIVLKKL